MIANSHAARGAHPPTCTCSAVRHRRVRRQYHVPSSSRVISGRAARVPSRASADTPSYMTRVAPCPRSAAVPSHGRRTFAEDPRDAPFSERGLERDVAAFQPAPALSAPQSPLKPSTSSTVAGHAAALLDDQPEARAPPSRAARRAARATRRAVPRARSARAQLPRRLPASSTPHRRVRPCALSRAAEPVERTEARVRQTLPSRTSTTSCARRTAAACAAAPAPRPPALAAIRSTLVPRSGPTRRGPRAQSRCHPARPPAPCARLHAERRAAPRRVLRPSPRASAPRRPPAVLRTVGGGSCARAGEAAAGRSPGTRSRSAPCYAPGVHPPIVSRRACARQPPTPWPRLRRALSRRGAPSAGRPARRGRAWSSYGRWWGGGATPRSRARDARCPRPARAAPRRAPPRP